jgi:cytochrome c peroxidase
MSLMTRARVLGSLATLAILACSTLVVACQSGDAGGKAADKNAKAPAKTTTDATKANDKTDGKTDGKTDDKGAVAGQPAAEWSWTLPKGQTEPPVVPADNPMTAAKVALGHQLFMDKRLSVDGSRSCYSCHQNHLGGADGRPLALGPGDKPLTRNTPTIWNVAYHQSLYWDGRAPTLEKQMLGAWKGGNMGVGDDLGPKTKEIASLPEYAPEFVAVFGLADASAVTPEHIAMAVSAYERTLLCGDTAFDKNEMSEPAQRGWELFRGKGSCTTCHAGDNFVDGAFHNVGRSHDLDGKLLENADVGRGKPAESEAENYKFRTPSLRNVTKTAPYFHDGSVADLTEAVRYMAGGGNGKAPGVDQNLRNTGLTEAEIADIVAFLGALECPGSLVVLGNEEPIPGI